mgnify:CR=1 FL=1
MHGFGFTSHHAIFWIGRCFGNRRFEWIVLQFRHQQRMVSNPSLSSGSNSYSTNLTGAAQSSVTGTGSPASQPASGLSSGNVCNCQENTYGKTLTPITCTAAGSDGLLNTADDIVAPGKLSCTKSCNVSCSVPSAVFPPGKFGYAWEEETCNELCSWPGGVYPQGPIAYSDPASDVSDCECENNSFRLRTSNYVCTNPETGLSVTKQVTCKDVCVVHKGACKVVKIGNSYIQHQGHNDFDGQWGLASQDAASCRADEIITQQPGCSLP